MKNTTRKTLTIMAVTLVVLIALGYVVHSLNLVDLIRKMHGGG